MTREETILTVLPHAYKTAGWFFKTHEKVVEIEELRGEAALITIKAVDSFNSSKGRTLKTWVKYKVEVGLKDLHERIARKRRKWPFEVVTLEETASKELNPEQAAICRQSGRRERPARIMDQHKLDNLAKAREKRWAK